MQFCSDYTTLISDLKIRLEAECPLAVILVNNLVSFNPSFFFYFSLFLCVCVWFKVQRAHYGADRLPLHIIILWQCWLTNPAVVLKIMDVQLSLHEFQLGRGYSRG